MIRTLATDRFTQAALGAFTPSALVRRVGAWASVARQRSQLAQLDPKQLEDIGVDADSAAAESARPFWDAPKSWKC